MACEGTPPAPTPRDSATDTTTCAETTWGTAAYDRLYALTAPDGDPWVFTLDPLALTDDEADEAALRLRAAIEVDPDALPDPARIALHNDIWGLVTRLSRGRASRESTHRLFEAATELRERLALPASRIEALPGDPIPAPVAAILDPAAGWREVASEMPVLGHEGAFGLRRIFRLARVGPEIAMFSQLVMLDTEGRAHLSAVPGELEQLTMGEQGATAAAVHELDRRALRCGAPPLHAVDRVEHVPGRGADRFLHRFETPRPLAELPCLRCHHDTHLGSLPTPALEPGWRWAALLEMAQSAEAEASLGAP